MSLGAPSRPHAREEPPGHSPTPPPPPEPSRDDQISFRFVLKTVGLLVHGRLPEGSFSQGVAGGPVRRGESGQERIGGGRIDKWFDLPLPEPDVLRPSLSPYRAISTTYPLYLPIPPPSLSTDRSVQDPFIHTTSTHPPPATASRTGTGIHSESSSYADVRSGGTGSSKPSSTGTGSNSGSGSEVRVRRPLENRVGGVKGGNARDGSNTPLSKQPSIDRGRGDRRGYISQPRPIASASSPSSSSSNPIVGFANLPPLLIAFILDLSDVDLGTGTAGEGARDELVYDEPCGGSRRTRLDPRIWEENQWKRDGSAREGQQSRRVPGIVLERWTLRSLPPTPANIASCSTPPTISSDPLIATDPDPLRYASRIQPSASAAYKAGIAHFQAVHPYLRGLPSTELQARGEDGREESNTKGKSLRLGMKIWVAEGREEDWAEDTSEDIHGGAALIRAWEKLEQGLIGLDVPFSAMDTAAPSSSTARPNAHLAKHAFPSILMPNALWNLTVESRMDIAGLQVIAAADPDARPAAGSSRGIRGSDVMDADLQEAYFTPTLLRKQRSTERTFENVDRGAAGSGAVDGTPRTVLPLGTQPPSGMRAGLSATRPSAFSTTTSGQGTSIPSAPTGLAFGAGRRRSSLGLRSHIADGGAHGSSVGSATMPVEIGNAVAGLASGGSYRPSSLLSQTGQSYTQLNQLSESRPRLQSLLTSPDLARQSLSTQHPTGPVRGTICPLSPSGSSLPRNVSTARIGSHPPTPPIPETYEGEPGSGSIGPQSFKRYSSSFGQRQRTSSFLGSVGSHGEVGTSLTAGYASMKRSGGVRGSSGEGPAGTSYSSGMLKATLSQTETEEISDFLRSLDIMTPPPSIMAMSGTQTRGNPTRVSSSSIVPSRTPPASTSRDPAIDKPPSISALSRKPLTRTQVDDTLKRMASSYIGTGQAFAQPGGSTFPASITRTPSFGARKPVLPNAPTMGMLSGRLAGPAPSSLTSIVGTNTLGYGASPSSISKEIILNRATSSSVKSSSPLAGAPIYAADPASERAVQPRSRPSLSEEVHQPPDSVGPLPPGSATSSVAGQHPNSSSSESGTEVSSVVEPPTARAIIRASAVDGIDSGAPGPTRAVQSLPGARTDSIPTTHAVPPRTTDDLEAGSPAGGAIDPGLDERDRDRDRDRTTGLGGGRRQQRAPVLLRGGFSPAPPSSSRSREQSLGPASMSGAHSVASPTMGTSGGSNNTNQAAVISPRMVPLPDGSSPITHTIHLPEAGGIGGGNNGNGNGYTRSGNGMTVLSPIGLTPSGLPPAIDMGMNGGLVAGMASPSLRAQRATPVGLSGSSGAGGGVGIGIGLGSIGRSQSHHTSGRSAGGPAPSSMFGMATTATGQSHGQHPAADRYWRSRNEDRERANQEHIAAAHHGLSDISRDRPRAGGGVLHRHQSYTFDNERPRGGTTYLDHRGERGGGSGKGGDTRARTPDDGDDVLGLMEMSEHKGQSG